MTSLTKRLMGKGTRWAMKHKEELVHNMMAVARNAVMSVAKKVKDNVLHMMTALDIVLQPTVLQNPVSNILYALLKTPNALVLKKVCMLMGNLKAKKPQLEPIAA